MPAGSTACLALSLMASQVWTVTMAAEAVVRIIQKIDVRRRFFFKTLIGQNRGNYSLTFWDIAVPGWAAVPLRREPVH